VEEEELVCLEGPVERIEGGFVLIFCRIRLLGGRLR
jgi:hypothetical protein